jgi:hypothetical protein
MWCCWIFGVDVNLNQFKLDIMMPGMHRWSLGLNAKLQKYQTCYTSNVIDVLWWEGRGGE